MREQTPRWLKRYVEYARDALGLTAWEITPLVEEPPNPDNPEADANAAASPDYLFAHLRFRPALVRKETVIAKVTVLHELLHVAFAFSDWGVERALEMVPGKQRGTARECYLMPYEQCVVRLSRALYEVLEPGWEAQKK